MKKTLLLASAAILALTTTANATGVNLKDANGANASATIHPTVDLVGSFTLTNTGDLKFGVIVNPKGGQSVTVTAAGNVSGTGDVSLLGENVGTDAGARATNTVSAGSFAVTGALDALVNRMANGASVTETNPATVQSVYIDMPDTTIDLYVDGVVANGKCGTVSSMTDASKGIPDINIALGQTSYTYGAMLTLAGTAGQPLNLTGSCKPATDPTVTLVMNPIANN